MIEALVVGALGVLLKFAPTVIEVMRGAKSNEEAIAKAKEEARKIDRQPAKDAHDEHELAITGKPKA